MRKIGQFGSICRRAARKLALGPVLLFVLLFAFAASPELHVALHADAGQTDHHCVIKVLAQSQLDAPPPETFAFLAATDVNYTPPVSLSVPGGAVELLPPGRAPPVVFS